LTYNLKKIATDLLKGKLPASAAPDLAKSRLSMCEACPSFTKLSRQCSLCGCYMDIKVKLLEAECPAGKW